MNYNNYLNKESGKQDIYTKNSLLKMTLQDIIDKEMELSYQYNTIGIPADEDMYASPYVRQYTAESGLPMWTSATDVINNLQSLRQFASQPNFFPKGLKSTQEMMEEERRKRLMRQQQNSEMDLDTTQADDMMKPLEVNPDANALNMEPEEQINPFENWSTKSQPVQQTSNTNSLVGNIGNLANKLSQKFGNPMEEKLGLKVPEEESITPNTRAGIAQKMNVPIEDRGIVPQNKTPKKGGIAPLQEQKYTLRTDPMWDDMKREMLDPNIAAQKKLQEARELDAFNQAWDRIHGETVEKKQNLSEALFLEDFNDKSNVLYGHVKKDNRMTFGEKLLDKFLQKNLIRKVYPSAADMYTDSRTDFSRARNNEHVEILESMDNLNNKTVKELKKYGVHSNERGVYHNENSEMSKKLGKSKELKEAFNKNIESIKNKNFNTEDLDFNAKLVDAVINRDKFDRHSSIQHAKLIDAYIDENAKKHARVIDNYDFNKRPDTLKNIPNNHGYSLQEKGALENYYTIMDVIIEDEEEKKNLFNKLLKKRRR